MDIEVEQLRTGLELSVIKKNGSERASAIAYSQSGYSYRGALIESDTHLLRIAPEQAALSRAVGHNDFPIYRMVSMTETTHPDEATSPITLKILIDYVRRTGTQMSYDIVDTKGNVLFETTDISNAIPFYRPPQCILARVERRSPVNSNEVTLTADGGEIKNVLKKYALMGLERTFPTYNSASTYAAAVITDDHTLYYSGQYSSFEKHTSVHAEMAAIIAALMDGKHAITHLGLVSSKYPDTPTNLCGVCRQFLSEMSARYNLNVKIFCFASKSSVYREHSLDTYLPNQWTSKKW